MLDRIRKRFPPYIWAGFASMLFAQLIVYYATRIVLPHLTLHDMALPLDDRIPFRPAWVSVYFLCYITWGVNSLWILSEGKQHGYRFAAAYILALMVSGVIFLAWPGTMRRPEVTGSGLSDGLMRRLYQVDSPTNLCPSLHVLFSYFCWRGTMGCKGIPCWYQWLSLLFLILVCFSILFVKQHVLVDIPSAVLVGEAALRLAGWLRLERVFLAAERHIQKIK